jgi:uncharacterized protein YydD (DUF2326 family)
MFLKKLSSSLKDFKTIEFHKGLNVILAKDEKRKKSSSSKDTSNALGKSTVFDLLNFMLGAKITDGDLVFPTQSEMIKEAIFYLDIEYEGIALNFERSYSDKSKIYISGNLNLFKQMDFLFKRDPKQKKDYLQLEDFRKFLQFLTVGDAEGSPSFRQLIKYPLRLAHEPNSPIDHYIISYKNKNKSKPAGDDYSIPLFFLGLGSRFNKELLDLEIKIKKIKAENKVLSELVPESVYVNAKVRLEQDIQRLEKQVESFKVVDAHAEKSERASDLVVEFEALSRKSQYNQQQIKRIEAQQEDLKQEHEKLDVEQVTRMYQKLKLELPDFAVKRLEEAQGFYKALATNHLSYIKEDLATLNKKQEGYDRKLRQLDETKAILMQELETGGALEQYLQYAQDLASLKADLEAQTKNYNLFILKKERLKSIEQEKIQVMEKLDSFYTEKFEQRSRVVKIFNEINRFIYEYKHEADLRIDTDPKKGLILKIDAPSKGSAGIDRASTITFDLTMFKQSLDSNLGFNFWCHDSHIFSDIDKNQVGHILNYILEMNQTYPNMQYICAFNDYELSELPQSILSSIQENTVLTLNATASYEETLFGFHFTQSKAKNP